MTDEEYRALIEAAWPWAHAMQTTLSSLGPARFDGRFMLVASDYAGEHEASGYRVYAFLLVDADASPEWPAARAQIRSQFLPDGRRLSFKRLGDRQRFTSLRPFLSAADTFTGVCFAAIVRKTIHRLSTTSNSVNVWRNLHGLKGRWDVGSFEAMVRVVHLFSLLTARWSSPGMDVSWLTDQDAVIANDERHTDMLELAGRMAAIYLPHSLRELALFSAAEDRGAREFEDFVAIPDLVAGALSETVSVWAREPHWHCADDLTLSPAALSRKSNIITEWFWRRASSLHRIAVLVESTEDGRGYVTHIDVDRGPAV